jgi:hypothetical protein
MASKGIHDYGDIPANSRYVTVLFATSLPYNFDASWQTDGYSSGAETHCLAWQLNLYYHV